MGKSTARQLEREEEGGKDAAEERGDEGRGGGRGLGQRRVHERVPASLREVSRGREPHKETLTALSVTKFLSETS